MLPMYQVGKLTVDHQSEEKEVLDQFETAWKTCCEKLDTIYQDSVPELMKHLVHIQNPSFKNITFNILRLPGALSVEIEGPEFFLQKVKEITDMNFNVGQ